MGLFHFPVVHRYGLASNGRIPCYINAVPLSKKSCRQTVMKTKNFCIRSLASISTKPTFLCTTACDFALFLLIF